MLEIKIEENRQYVRCEGSSYDLLAELMISINAIYTQMHKANPMVALAFKRTLLSALADPACPAWVPNAKGAGISFIFPKR